MIKAEHENDGGNRGEAVDSGAPGATQADVSPGSPGESPGQLPSAGLRRFREELKALLNCASMENRSNTPDFILADYLTDCLEAYDKAVNHREVWYGRKTALTKPQ